MQNTPYGELMVPLIYVPAFKSKTSMYFQTFLVQNQSTVLLFNYSFWLSSIKFFDDDV